MDNKRISYTLTFDKAASKGVSRNAYHFIATAVRGVNRAYSDAAVTAKPGVSGVEVKTTYGRDRMLAIVKRTLKNTNLPLDSLIAT